MDENGITSATARILIPGENGSQFDSYTHLEVEGRVHRVGLPPESIATFSWPVQQGTQRQLQTVSGESQEWAGLLTLIYNRRIEALEELIVGVEGNTVNYTMPLCDRIDSSLMAPTDGNLDESQLMSLLPNLLSLSPDEYDALSAAIQMHYSACLLSTREINGSYTILVGALELLAKKFGHSSGDWGAWSESSKWESTFKKAKVDDTQKKLLQEALLKENQHRNLGRTFRDYILEHIPLEFWSEPIKDWVHMLDAGHGTISGGDWQQPRPRFTEKPSHSQIEKALKGTYEARSKFVHEGKRMVDLASEMQIQIRPNNASRLPLRALREATRYIILKELKERSKPFDLPQIKRSQLWTPLSGWYT